MSTSLQPPHDPPAHPHPQDTPLSDDQVRDSRVPDDRVPDDRVLDDQVLDNPAWAALNGAHRHLAEVVGQAGRYLEDVAPFVAIADADDPQAWADLTRLIGPGNSFSLSGVARLPEGWTAGEAIPGVQLVGTSVRGEFTPEAAPLSAADVPDMLDLVARTRPGPFRPRTVEMGSYVGIWHRGALVAMAGERLHPPGWTEISAVCTDPAHRGRGFASRLVRHVAAGIQARGDVPFLHAAAANTPAIRIYESLGFTLRRHTLFRLVHIPPHPPTTPEG
ncbi:GNAT family N-acetyltransferase [Actinacidiphila yeochonensis]|uniref:GNAT family N-acetyltransferase n=1 Tax=Actinacidiphila yeochonensis TaxID=89050 RepID=UPI0005646286|nr:GNAT family N-acetyltransferase [Actinacidiphila yeochonensis]